MADYSYTTDFGGKDALPTGDPDKVIRGADYDFEFVKIQTMSQEKMDKTGGTFTGPISGTTATFDTGTFTTLNATTAILTGALTGTTAVFSGKVTASEINGGTF